MKTKFLSLVSFFEKYLNCTSHTRAVPIKSAFIQNCWQSLLVFQCDRFFNRALKICSFTFPRSLMNIVEISTFFVHDCEPFSMIFFVKRYIFSTFIRPQAYFVEYIIPFYSSPRNKRSLRIHSEC